MIFGDFFGWIEWLSKFRIDDCKTACELILKKLASFQHAPTLYDSDSLISALNVLFAEADESDDPEYIREVVSLHDRFMRFNIHKFETFLEAATTTN